MNSRVGMGGMRGNNRGRNNDMMMMRGPRMNEMMNQVHVILLFVFGIKIKDRFYLILPN